MHSKLCEHAVSKKELGNFNFKSMKKMHKSISFIFTHFRLGDIYITGSMRIQVQNHRKSFISPI